MRFRHLIPHLLPDIHRCYSLSRWAVSTPSPRAWYSPTCRAPGGFASSGLLCCLSSSQGPQCFTGSAWLSWWQLVDTLLARSVCVCELICACYSVRHSCTGFTTGAEKWHSAPLWSCWWGDKEVKMTTSKLHLYLEQVWASMFVL